MTILYQQEVGQMNICAFELFTAPLPPTRWDVVTNWRNVRGFSHCSSCAKQCSSLLGSIYPPEMFTAASVAGTFFGWTGKVQSMNRDIR